MFPAVRGRAGQGKTEEIQVNSLIQEMNMRLSMRPRGASSASGPMLASRSKSSADVSRPIRRPGPAVPPRPPRPMAAEAPTMVVTKPTESSPEAAATVEENSKESTHQAVVMPPAKLPEEAEGLRSSKIQSAPTLEAEGDSENGEKKKKDNKGGRPDDSDEDDHSDDHSDEDDDDDHGTRNANNGNDEFAEEGDDEGESDVDLPSYGEDERELSSSEASDDDEAEETDLPRSRTMERLNLDRLALDLTHVGTDSRGRAGSAESSEPAVRTSSSDSSSVVPPLSPRDEAVEAVSAALLSPRSLRDTVLSTPSAEDLVRFGDLAFQSGAGEDSAMVTGNSSSSSLGLVLVGGTFPALVEYFVLEGDLASSPPKPELRWSEAFVRSFHALRSADALVDELQRLYGRLEQEPGRRGASVVARFVQRWILAAPTQFGLGSPLRRRVAMLLEPMGDEEQAGRAAALLDQLAHGQDVVGATEKPNTRLVRAKTTSISTRQLKQLRASQAAEKSRSILEVDPKELARQFTHLHWSQYKALSAAELLSMQWTQQSQQQPPVSAEESTIAPLIRDVNRLIQWLQLAILRECNLKSRAAVVCAVMRMGRQFLHDQNFLGAMAVLAVLESAAVHRLRRTMERVPSKLAASFDRVRRTFDSARGFRAYRDAFANSEGAAIPYIGVHLADLVQLNEAQPLRCPAAPTLLNFSRLLLFDSAVGRILHRKLFDYDQLRAFSDETLRTSGYVSTQLELVDMSYSEESFYALSLGLEPHHSHKSGSKKKN